MRKRIHIGFYCTNPVWHFRNFREIRAERASRRRVATWKAQTFADADVFNPGYEYDKIKRARMVAPLAPKGWNPVQAGAQVLTGREVFDVQPEKMIVRG